MPARLRVASRGDGSPLDNGELMTRIMGLLLAAIAMQFVISGARDAWHAVAQ
jgi:hypothetical protein